MSLTLPKYGDALTLFTSQRKEGDPPPRKTARLDPTASGSARTSTSTHGGPIKLTLKGGPVSSEPPVSYTRTLLGRMANCIRVTLPTTTSGTESMSISEAYVSCRVLVRNMDMGEDIYRILTQQLEQYRTKLLGELKPSTALPMTWLDVLATEWKLFDNRLKTLQCMLSDIDQFYVPPHSKLITVYELGLRTFGELLQDPIISDRVQAGITEWLTQERLNPGQDVNMRRKHRETIVTVRKCLVSLRLYGDLVETPYLQATTAYWTDEGAVRRNADDFSASKYIADAIEIIKGEEDRAREVLLPGGWEPVGRATEKALLADVAPTLASKALQTLLVTKNKPAISALYGLYRSAEVLPDLRQAFKNILQENVRSIVMAGVDDSTNKKGRAGKGRSRGKVDEDEKMVPLLVELRAFAKAVVKECFGETTRGQFASTLDDSFSLGVSTRDYTPGAMMAQALDRELRRGQRGETEHTWKNKLFDILDLSRYTRGKYIVQELRSNADICIQIRMYDDMEKTLIVKLKSDYDPEFSAGDVMFRDLQQSATEMEDYRRRIENSASDIDLCLDVMVLTHAKWPSFKENNMLESEESAKSHGRANKPSTASHVDLPPHMAEALHRFEVYYKEKHDRHRMAWFHSLGTVTLTSRFPGGNKEISVSTYQALVLLLFNEQDQFSAAEIQSRTRLSQEDLTVTLQSLALGKKHVLLRADRKTTKDIALEDQFKWNSGFTDPKRNIRILSIQQQTTTEETQDAQDDVLGGRPHAIDAAIVRIMKAKKTLTYEQIKTETIIALEKHFQPTVSDIKKRIDELQEKDYIVRDSKEKNVFHYVA
ncbi:cullin family [Rhizoctonia solani]|uniref:Cullin family n=1 Tax=Rhizoctonia solani TaxID=456999 RepID=A0A8H7IIZ3_9AGAM|nr:cullin family [Rhizoctonia solani]KAF8757701.1 cullin family [Rhizoctonia solani]